MNARSFFKLFIYLVNWIKVSLIAFPFSLALISLKKPNTATIVDENGNIIQQGGQLVLKYGYDFFVIDYNWAIMIALGIGLALNTWHALSFEELGNFDLKQYLKVRQRYRITHSEMLSSEQVEKKLRNLETENPFWKLSSLKNGFTLYVKNKFGFRDVVQLQPGDGGYIVQSKPRFWLDFIDMGRNLKNVQFISKYLKVETPK
ncbi:MAG: hypothetical protein JJ975_01745 [Bacteroidia bacterium]|nr:hypothetical protein [Bacteroidia bacterium]